jgi:hypothetical protein
MIRMPILVHSSAPPTMPLPKVAGTSVMRFSVAPELPPMAPETRLPPPASLMRPGLRATLQVPLASRWLLAVKMKFHLPGGDISSRASSSPNSLPTCIPTLIPSSMRRRTMTLMHHFCHRLPSIPMSRMVPGDHSYPANAQSHQEMIPSLPNCTPHSVCRSAKAHSHLLGRLGLKASGYPMSCGGAGSTRRGARPPRLRRHQNLPLLGDSSRTVNWRRDAVSMFRCVRRRAIVTVLVPYRA